MFGFFGGVEVVPVSLSEGLLAFRSMKSLTIGKKAKVKLFLPDVSLPTLSVVTVAQQPVEDGSFLCSAGISESPETVAALTETLAMAGIEGACRRRSPRVPAVVRILSRELTNFRAVTRDISETGALLVCDGEVAVGAYLTLKLNLEAVGVPELMVQVRCVRCRREDDSGRIPKFLAGVMLTQQHPGTHAAWTKFYEHTLEKQGASVMVRSLDGGAGADSSARFRTIQAPPPAPAMAPPPSPARSPAPAAPPAMAPAPAQAWSPAPAAPPSMAPAPAQAWSSPPAMAPPAQAWSPAPAAMAPPPAAPAPAVAWSPPPAAPAPAVAWSPPPAAPAPAVAWSPPPAAPAPTVAWSPPPARAPAPAQAWAPPPAAEPPAASWGAFAAQAPIRPDFVAPPAVAPAPAQRQPAAEPPRVEPLAINQANLVFRTGYRPDLVPGARGPVTLPLWYQGQWTSVVITVGLVRVELTSEGCQCWCTIFEDQTRVQFLNQVLGTPNRP